MSAILWDVMPSLVDHYQHVRKICSLHLQGRSKTYGVTLKITVFWDVMLQGLVDHYQLSEESATSIFTLLPKEQATVSS
jgi:hypothetical protein